MRYFLLFPMLFFLASTCNSTKETQQDEQEKTNEETSTPSYVFPYSTNQPDESRELPETLTEISGLSMAEDGTIYAVQDENGSIFTIKGEEITETNFRKDGDYEGIEAVGEYIYVVKSSGTVYKVSHLGTDQQMREDFNDFLDDGHDVEGLCYQAATNSLLLACKSYGKTENGIRAIYQFDLNTNKVLETPLAEISIESIKETIHKNATEHNNEAFAQLIEDKGDKITFAPSAIAPHPITGNYYLTSSKGKLLMVVNNEFQLLHLEKLDKNIHEQPEGLTFDKDGNLYISNEGKKKSGMLYKFNYRK